MTLSERIFDISTLLVSALILVAVLVSVIGQPLGLAFVETGSMAPTMEPGDGFVALPPALTGGVSEGDVVVFDAQTIEGGELTTHRVVGRTSEGYITRGDANPFTDQQGGEPPVPRERVVAEALQVGGHVVVIPNLGEGVGAIRGVFTTVGGWFGLSVNQVVAFALVGLLTAYLLDETGAGGEERTERSVSRNTGFSGVLLIGGAVALVVVVATLSMTAASGAVALPYDSVEPGAADRGGIPAGTSANASVELTNGGLVPMTATLSTADPNATLAAERVSLPPRSTRTVNVTIAAPAEPGSYEVSVERHQYLGVLPGSVLSTLSSVSHWLAVATVDLLLAAAVGLLGGSLVGTGRVRLRPERPVRIETRVIRWLRSLYAER
jgi:signal peptidase